VKSKASAVATTTTRSTKESFTLVRLPRHARSSRRFSHLRHKTGRLTGLTARRGSVADARARPGYRRRGPSLYPAVARTRCRARLAPPLSGGATEILTVAQCDDSGRAERCSCAARRRRLWPVTRSRLRSPAWTPVCGRRPSFRGRTGPPDDEPFRGFDDSVERSGPARWVQHRGSLWPCSTGGALRPLARRNVAVTSRQLLAAGRT
jgi:hypothetical protein